MTARLLLDTNVIVYPHDPSEPEKQRAAALLVERIHRSGVGCISTQVLSEFYSVMTTKLRPRIPQAAALASLERHANLWRVFPVTTEVILEAAHASVRFGIHFWNAQLWAVAHVNQLGYIVSEDMQHGVEIGGVRILSPFRHDWRMEDLVR